MSKRKFFSGNSVRQAVVSAASFFDLAPDDVAYREVDKKHGFLKMRKKVIIEVDADDPSRPPAEIPAIEPEPADRSRGGKGGQKGGGRSRGKGKGGGGSRYSDADLEHQPPPDYDDGGGRRPPEAKRQEDEVDDDRGNRTSGGGGRGGQSGGGSQKGGDRSRGKGGGQQKQSGGGGGRGQQQQSKGRDDRRSDKGGGRGGDQRGKGGRPGGGGRGDDSRSSQGGRDESRGQGGRDDRGGRDDSRGQGGRDDRGGRDQRGGDSRKGQEPRDDSRKPAGDGGGGGGGGRGRGKRGGRKGGRDGGNGGRGRSNDGRGGNSGRGGGNDGGSSGNGDIVELPERSRSAAERYREEATGPMADACREALERVLDVAGIDVEHKVYEGEDRFEVDLSGPDEEMLVAQGGDLLRAVEHLVPRAMRGVVGDSTLVRVNCGDFHEIHEERLRSQAQQVAAEVRKSNKPSRMEPMSPADRRIVHVTLADEPGVTTNSDGNGHYKQVVVKPA